jgi:hypothetical protein
VQGCKYRLPLGCFLSKYPVKGHLEFRLQSVHQPTTPSGLFLDPITNMRLLSLLSPTDLLANEFVSRIAE